MKAVVTGCAGFIGSKLTSHLLAQGLGVVGIDAMFGNTNEKKANMAGFINSKDFQFELGDINYIDLRRAAGLDVDYIFHLAAKAGARLGWKDDFSLYVHNNINATQKMLSYANELSTRHLKAFIFASSSSVYGCSRKLLTEKSKANPSHPYGMTKLSCEYLCKVYNKVPVTILRYFTVYGEHQRPDMGIRRLIKCALSNQEFFVFGSLNSTRTYTYVDDVVSATYQAALADKAGSVYNICGNEDVTMAKLVDIISDLAGEDIMLVIQKRPVGEPESIIGSSELALHDFGYKPLVDIENGVETEFRWLSGNYEKYYGYNYAKNYSIS